MGRLTGALKRVAGLARAIPERPVGAVPDVPTDNLAPSANEDTIRALLEHIRILVAFDENRATQLVARGTGLIGFASIAVAVLTVGGANQRLTSTSRILIALAVGLLIFCVGAVVLGIFATREMRHHGMRQIRLYRNSDYWTLTPGRVQVQMLDALVGRLDTLRAANRLRASWLNRAALALVFAVVCAGLATTVSTISPTKNTTHISKGAANERR